MVVDKILFDFGLILGPVYIRVLKFRVFVRACFQAIVLSISASKFRRSEIKHRGIRMERMLGEFLSFVIYRVPSLPRS